MTPAEKKALLFLALVALLGATVRALRAMRDDVPPPTAARAALARQIQAVDSAGAAARARAGGAGKSAPGRSRSASRTGIATAPATEPAGGIRIVRGASPAFTTTAPAAAPARIDLDVAGPAEIQRLPHVGPVLARRIVADRDTFGPFGTIDNLRRVTGVGPALAKRLEPLVTFSLTPRPPNAVFGRVKLPPTSPDSSARRRRRRRPPA